MTNTVKYFAEFEPKVARTWRVYRFDSYNNSRNTVTFYDKKEDAEAARDFLNMLAKREYDQCA